MIKGSRERQNYSKISLLKCIWIEDIVNLNIWAAFHPWREHQSQETVLQEKWQLLEV